METKAGVCQDIQNIVEGHEEWAGRAILRYTQGLSSTQPQMLYLIFLRDMLQTAYAEEEKSVERGG
jgi:hypothetical protein